MKIVFWSPNKGRCHTTSSMLAISSTLAFTSGLRTCVISANSSDKYHTAILGKDSMLNDSISTFGLDALFRDVKGSALSKSNIEDAALDLSARYSVFASASTTDKKLIDNDLMACHSDLFNALDAIYSLVFIDTKGGFSALNQQILAEADLIVICLNQSAYSVNKAFSRCKFGAQNCMFLIGDYDSGINISPKNLQKKYKEVTSKNSAVVPHNADFANAMNSGTLYSWMALNQKCKMKDPNYGFFKEVNSASEKLMKLLKK